MTAFEKYNSKIDAFVSENVELRKKLLKELCYIPAPTGSEEKRAYYCLEYLKTIGAADAYIDDENNVVFEYNCSADKKATLICAHTDIVFPDMAPMPYIEDPKNDMIKCPGVGDNTANITAVLLTVKFFLETGLKPKDGIIFLFESKQEVGGEGMTSFMTANRERVCRVLVMNSINWVSICDKVVAKKEYHIKVSTIGGHAQHAFGSPNAIVVASRIIDKIYQISIPGKPRLVATYNVGLINGGKEKNMIASECEFDLECRSNDKSVFDYLTMFLETCISEADTDEHKVEITAEDIKEGDIGVDEVEFKDMIAKSSKVISHYSLRNPIFASATTSANIPMSMGIPSLCLGSIKGGYSHSLNEYIRISSLAPGLAAAIGFAVSMTM